MATKNKQPRTPKIFQASSAQTDSPDISTSELAYRNTLQTVAQMRKAQMALGRNPKDQAIALDVKRLEAAVDTRLGTFDIKAVE